MTPDHDDPAGTRLGQLLADAASQVVPEPGSLQHVLRRAQRPRPWLRLAPVVAVAACAAVVAGAGALVLRQQSPAPQSPGTSRHPPSSAVSTPPATPANQQVLLPVYFASVFNGQARLYREYVPYRSSNRGRDAAALSLAGRTSDPDYRSLWPAGTRVLDYQVSGSVAAVTVDQPLPAQYASAALQQLVYTVTAADPSVHSLLITAGGVTGAQLGRADPAKVLAPVWVLSPVQGATVSSPVLFSGTASVFEAVVSFEIDRVGGTKVMAGTAHASIGAPGTGTWSTQVQLPAGTYQINAYEVSAKDGSRTWVDSKAFTVR